MKKYVWIFVAILGLGSSSSEAWRDDREQPYTFVKTDKLEVNVNNGSYHLGGSISLVTVKPNGTETESRDCHVDQIFSTGTWLQVNQCSYKIWAGTYTYLRGTPLEKTVEGVWIKETNTGYKGFKEIN